MSPSRVQVFRLGRRIGSTGCAALARVPQTVFYPSRRLPEGIRDFNPSTSVAPGERDGIRGADATELFIRNGAGR